MAQENKINQNPFKVPENYFDELTGKVLASTVESSQPEKLPVNRRLRQFLAIAASVAVLLTIGYFSGRLSHERSVSDAIDVSQIISTSPEIFDEVDLMTLENSVASRGDLEAEPDLTSDEIVDYLLDEAVDISIIYEKL